MKKAIKLISGIVFFMIGLLLLLFTLNILPIKLLITTIINLHSIWPIGFIIAGIMFILNKKITSLLIFFITIILGVSIFITTNLMYDINNENINELHIISLNNNFNQINNNNTNKYPINYNINFSGGTFNIKKIQKENHLLKLNITDIKKTSPPIKMTKYENNTREINVNRKLNQSFFFFNNPKNTNINWDLEINNNTPTNININSAIAVNNIYLKNLKTNKLNIENGISNINLFYSNYPTKTNIKTGISDIQLYFPINSSILITINGGILDIDLKNFKKIGNRYYSKNYIENSNSTIHININAGISKISGGIINEI